MVPWVGSSKGWPCRRGLHDAVVKREFALPIAKAVPRLNSPRLRLKRALGTAGRIRVCMQSLRICVPPFTQSALVVQAGPPAVRGRTIRSVLSLSGGGLDAADLHSARRASAGSVAAARRSGRSLVRTNTAPIAAANIPNVAGSWMPLTKPDDDPSLSLNCAWETGRGSDHETGFRPRFRPCLAASNVIVRQRHDDQDHNYGRESREFN